MQKNSVVFQNIQNGLNDFYVVARARTKARFAKMPRSHKYLAARALTLLRDVANNPEEYFSPAATDAAWTERGRAYARAHGVATEWAKYNLVKTPADIVVDSVDAAFIEEPALRTQFELFCDGVFDWFYEYADGKSKRLDQVEKNAKKIADGAKRIHTQAEIIRQGKFMYHLTHNKLFQALLFQER